MPVARLSMCLKQATHRYMCVYLTPVYTHLDAQINTDTHTNTGSSNSLILFPSLVEWDGGPLVRIYIHRDVCRIYILYIYKNICIARMAPPPGLTGSCL